MSLKTSVMASIKRLIWRLPFMISCEELEDFIYDYLEDRLPESTKTKFELHLKLCAECRHYLAVYRRTVELGQSLGTGGELPEMPDELVRAIMSARE